MNEENNKEVFQCICGKQFETEKLLAKHQARCKTFINSKRLPNGMFKCENPDCGKEHDGSYGSGRFCCEKCKFHYASLRSAQSAIQSGKKFNSRPNQRLSYGHWKCERCNLIFETRAQLKKHNHEFHPIPKGQVWNKGLTKETDKRIAKYVQTNYERNHYGKTTRGIAKSIEQRDKISTSMKKFYKEHPELVPYKLHHSSKESYPEKYFNDLFKNENIVGFKRDYYVDGYYLDFAFIDKKIDFEVDGSQHYVDPKIVEHDKIRTKHLESLGWKIFRIDWRLWQKMDNEQKRQKINDFKLLLIQYIT